MSAQPAYASLPSQPQGAFQKYEQIYRLVGQIPYGTIATYGQIAALVGGCTPRMVGYALSSLSSEMASEIPWQRVVNRLGRVSPHGCGIGSFHQRQLLEEEGIQFSDRDQIDFNQFGWIGKP